MKYTLLMLLLIFPIVSTAEIYKCKQSNGKVGFSDNPCPKGVVSEQVDIKSKKSDWVDRLQAGKSASITILDVIHNDGDVTIKYTFKTKSDSNEFLRFANEVSGIQIVLMKYIAPDSGRIGRAELLVSSKPNPLFKKLEVDRKQ